MQRDFTVEMERRIRRELEYALGQQLSVDDWDWLVREDYVSDTIEGIDLDPRETRRQELIDQMASGLRAHWEKLDVDRLVFKIVRFDLPEALLDETDLAQAIARSYALAREAETLPVVSRFREEELGGGVRDAKEAIAYLIERLPSSGWLNHEEGVEWRTSRNSDFWLSVSIDETSPLSLLAESLFIDLPYIEFDSDPSIMRLSQRYDAWRESPIAQAAAALTDRFPWSVGAASWFLLTNAVPFVSPLRGSLNVSGVFTPGSQGDIQVSRSTISLTYDDWLSAETLRRVGVFTRHDLLGRPNKSISLSSYHMYIIMSELRRRHGNDISATVVHEALERYRDAPGNGDVTWKSLSPSAVQQAYKRVEKALRRPAMTSGGGAASPRSDEHA